MCFCDQTVYEKCPCRKWSSPRLPCSRLQRSGACGMKMVENTIEKPGACSVHSEDPWGFHSRDPALAQANRMTRLLCASTNTGGSTTSSNQASDHSGTNGSIESRSTMGMPEYVHKNTTASSKRPLFQVQAIHEELNKLNLELHSLHPVPGRYECLCDKNCENPKSLLSHVDGHIKPFVCVTCESQGHAENRFTDLATCGSHIRANHLSSGNGLPSQSFKESLHWKEESVNDRLSKLRALAGFVRRFYEAPPAPQEVVFEPNTGHDDMQGIVYTASEDTVNISAGDLQPHNFESNTYDSERAAVGHAISTPPEVLENTHEPSSNRDSLEQNSILGGQTFVDSDPISPIAPDGFSSQYKGYVPENGVIIEPGEDQASHNSSFNGDRHDKQSPVRDRFDEASQAAYYKLKAASESDSSSRAFRDFVGRLGSHRDLVLRGFGCFDEFLSHKTLSSLEDVYSFLHIAFAISQTQLTTPVRSTPADFYHSVYTLRNCLSDEEVVVEDASDGALLQEYKYKPRDVFDEIVDVMQDEIDYAISWLQIETGGWFRDDMTTKLERLQLARNMLMRPIAMEVDTHLAADFASHIYDLPPMAGNDMCPEHGLPPSPVQPLREKPKWLDIATGSVFLIVVEFMKYINKCGELFFESDAPYSFLCEYDPEPSSEAFTPPVLEDAVNDRIFMIESFEDQVVRPLPSITQELRSLVDAGLRLLREKALETIRQFQTYISGFGRRLYANTPQFTTLLGTVLENSTKFILSLEQDATTHTRQGNLTASLTLGNASPKTQTVSKTSDQLCHNGVRPSDEILQKGWDNEDQHDPVIIQDEQEDLEPGVNTNSSIQNPADKVASTSPAAAAHVSVASVSSSTNDQHVWNYNLGRRPCDLDGCDKTFTSNSNLYRHRREQHSSETNYYKCEVAGCGKMIQNRKGNFERHMKKVHGIRETVIGKGKKRNSRAIITSSADGV